jgi:2-iminobutanoate/2-iminopropanoate deaminase
LSPQPNGSTKIVPQSQQHTTAGPYSPVLEIRASSLVVISGQAAIQDDGSLYPDDIAVQSRQTLLNCERQLTAANCGLADVFKVNVYLTDLQDWPAFNSVYREMMPEPLPVRTAVQAALLENFLVEIEMWAAKP